MTIYRKLMQIYNQRPKKGQKGFKMGQKMVKIKNAIEIPFMSAFLHNLYMCIWQSIVIWPQI